MVTTTGLQLLRWRNMGISDEEIQFLLLLYRNEHWPTNLIRFDIMSTVRYYEEREQ